MRHTLRTTLVAIILLLLSASFVQAQNPQCGFADSISYPVDTSVFQLAQDFGVSSTRHQGRYHTGEDWYFGRGNDYGYGLPVMAAATGRVTYSSPIGWGRDGGVVILEHTFFDGSIIYSQYGHMVELDTAKFPTRYTCVKAGDVIGAVGNARPAPHIHFEIRVNNPDYPGPGYSWENPVSLGWREPAKFIRNWSARLQPAYSWHFDLTNASGLIAPPLQLEDNSLVYIDTGRLGRITPDGRLLWRINLERPVISVTNFGGLPLITYSDGSMQRVNLDGTLSERWETAVPVESLAISTGDTLVFHAPGNILAGFGPDRQQVAWTAVDMPPISRSQVASQVIGVITNQNELLTLSLQGNVLDRAQLRETGSLATAPDGTLVAYTRGGLWRILADGIWQIWMESAPIGGQSASLALSENGSIYLYDGRLLHAYNQDQAEIWQTELPSVSGLTELSVYEDIVLLTGNHGPVIAVRVNDGGLCNRIDLFGSDRARLWHSLGADGILRIAVEDQIMGLDWQKFLGGCR